MVGLPVCWNYDVQIKYFVPQSLHILYLNYLYIVDLAILKHSFLQHLLFMAVNKPAFTFIHPSIHLSIRLLSFLIINFFLLFELFRRACSNVKLITSNFTFRSELSVCLLGLTDFVPNFMYLAPYLAPPVLYACLSATS